jgi:mannose-6-phosphate isomerase-like protein (cupin superfamily)
MPISNKGSGSGCIGAWAALGVLAEKWGERMAKRKYVLRMDEAELEQLPDVPHHHGGWTVRDPVRKAGLAGLPIDRLPVDIVEMNLPPGAWQEEGNHKGRRHVNYVLSGTGEFNIDGQEYPVQKGSVIIIAAETPHAGRTTSPESLVMFAIHVRSARTADDRLQGTHAWQRNP